MGRVMEHLFVYGTLAPGQPNEHVLAPYAGTWTPATVRGELLDRGWGPENGYPSIALRADFELALLFRRIATVELDVEVGTVDDWEWRGPTDEFAEIATRLGEPKLAERAASLARAGGV